MNAFTEIELAIAVAVAGTILVAFVEELIRRRQLSRVPKEKDWGFEMQQAAEAHLSKVDEAFWLEEEEGDTQVDGPAVAPYCGCQTCIVREVLAGAWPVISDFVSAMSKRRVVDLHLRVGEHADDDYPRLS